MIIIPVGVDYQASRYPTVTLTFIGICVVVFAGQLAAVAAGVGHDVYMNFGLVPAQHGWWAWVTSIFLHGGILHLVGNIIYLFLFGSCVEDTIGRGKFVGFYLVGGLVANIIQVLFSTDINSHLPIIGASGAISACIGAFLVLLPKTGINFRYFIFWFYTGDFWLPSWVVITFWFLMDLVSMLITLNDTSGEGGVAFGAHVGGTIAGALMMLALRKKTGEPEKILRKAAPLAQVPADPPGTPPVYLSVDGNQTGPFAPASIRSMLQLGAIPVTAYYWREDLGEWRPVSEL